uniref:WW domain-containing protein n=1 Tax=Heterorhabditis bacteriophora TaxID=37862 RepID=A0A1I7XKH9_HETBA
MPIAGQYIAQDVDLSEYRSCDIKPLSLSRRLSQERKHNCEDRIEEYKGGEENYVKQYESASGRQHSNSSYSIAWDLGYQRQSYPEMLLFVALLFKNFYARHEVESPPRRLPPADYVIDEEEIVETIFTPESHDSGVAFENQYSRPLRHVQPLPVIERDDEVKPLPPGWEKHQDPSGFSYYWHVDSGTIQRDPPHNVTPPHSPLPPPAPMYSRTSLSRETQVDSPSTQVVQLPPIQPVIEEHAFKQTTTKRRLENSQENNSEEEYGHGKPIRFAVRSLGWIEIAEEELTAERSSRAVNKAIVDLSTGRNDVLDNVSKWGDVSSIIGYLVY